MKIADYIKYSLAFAFLSITFSLLVVSCAQVGSLGGGPKDKVPPIPVEMIPPNYSSNFKGNKIEIKFSEFVILDKINEQLLVSPPIKEFPDFRLKGKSLVIKFKEPLKENTTYTLFFGDAIKDLTEGNPIHNFTYIFSTGDHVDSLSMMGHVVNAFDLIPREGIAVMLYRNNNDTIPFDSLPLRVPPYYLTKTDKKGDFFITGLADDRFLVFALHDQNNNYVFDQPTEEIAFLDSLYHPYYIEPVENSPDTVLSDSTLTDSVTVIETDSLLQDTSLIVSDTINDSLLVKPDSTQQPSYEHVQLFLFLQKDTVLRLLEAKLIRLNTLRFFFSTPADELLISVENKTNDSLWYREEWSAQKDTLTWYLKEKNIDIDTFNILFMKNQDTLDYIYLPIKPREKTLNIRKKKKELKKPHFLGFQSNMKGNVKPGQELFIEFNQPIEQIRFDSVLFVSNEDSVFNPPFRFVDSLNRKMVFPYEVEPGSKYMLALPDSCIMDWNGYFNQAAQLVFSSKELKAYGTLTLHVQPENDSSSYILQWLNKKEKLLKQIFFSHDTTVTFQYLDPGDYLLKVIFDRNQNKEWDTGDYLNKIEPEQVTYYHKVITIRSNWELEETWTFDDDDRTVPPLKRKAKN